MKKRVLFGIALVAGVFLFNVMAAEPAKDEFNYAKKEFGEKSFELKNNWMFSNVLNNYNEKADLIGAATTVRGMAVQDGKMLFVDRANKQITVVNALTGAKETPIKLAQDIFTYQGKNKAGTADSTFVAGTLPFNDIKIDNMGNVLLGNCITSSLGRFQVWQVDLSTGNGKLILDEKDLKTNFPDGTIRFDAFGVYGNVQKRAVICAVNALAAEIYLWEVKYGVAGPAKLIEVDIKSESLIKGFLNFGSAPQIFPISESIFYLDGNTTFPTLLNNSGTVLDDFSKNKTALTDSITVEGQKFVMNQGHNGLVEFWFGGEYFLLVAATNTEGTPKSTFRLFKFKDANRKFSELECMWTFPKDGMGGASNAYRTAIPAVELIDANTARISVYTGENGYGTYNLSYSGPDPGVDPEPYNDIEPDPDVSVKELFDANIGVFVSGKTISFSETIASVEVYDLTGRLIAKGKNLKSIDLDNTGVYIVKVLTHNNKTARTKVLVK